MKSPGIFLVSALVIGCGGAGVPTVSDTSDELVSATDAQWRTSCSNAAASSGVDRVTLTGGVSGYPSEIAIQDVTVCAGPAANGGPTCMTTGPDGIFRLDVAPCIRASRTAPPGTTGRTSFSASAPRTCVLGRIS
jgi:hypothetical protein